MKKEISSEYLLNIWARYKSGDREAYAVLYNLYIDTLYSYGTKLCKDEEMVKDALQELFLDLFIKCDKIKIAPETLKFYLFLALKRNLIKKIQANRKISYKFDETVDFEPEYSIEFKIMEQEKDAEINKKVTSALAQLPPKQKEAIYLRFNESLEYNEIALILDIEVESVRKQVHRALKSVREIIGNEVTTILFLIFHKKR